jgi:hypothetical protein
MLYAFDCHIFFLILMSLTKVMRAKVCILDSNYETGLVAHSGVDIACLPRFLGGNLPDSKCPAPQPVQKGAGSMVWRQLS